MAWWKIKRGEQTNRNGDSMEWPMETRWRKERKSGLPNGKAATGGGIPTPAMDRTVLCMERYGTGVTCHYIPDPQGRLREEQVQKGQTAGSLVAALSDVFLPQGYPESVSTDYLPYQTWDTVQAFASTITGALATQSVLRGVGVGDRSATVAGASLTWMLKDGTSMIGRILFAWVKGTQLDRDAKQWRMLADILNDVAIFIEIVAPLFSDMFTLLICVSCLLKSIVGVSGGASRAALTLHQARRDNMADVSAKDGSQETLVNLAGLVTSILLSPFTSDHLLLTHLLFCLFTALHLYANYRAVRSVVMETLNPSRLRLLLSDFLREGFVPPPGSVNLREPLLPAFCRREKVRLGTSLNTILHRTDDYERAIQNNMKNYLIGVHQKTGEVCVSLREGAGSQDMIQGALHAEILVLLLCRDGARVRVEAPTWEQLQREVQTAQDDRLWDVVAATHLLVDQLWPGLLSEAQAAGWWTERNQLGAEEWRGRWGLMEKKGQ